MFESDFAKTEYIANDNVVFHVWKKKHISMTTEIL